MTTTRRFGHYSRQKLWRMAEMTRWVHTMDLGGGHRTDGEWGTGNPRVREAFDTIDFQGKKVLDIGCWDGAYSFEAEQRGASEVFATDLVDQRRYASVPDLSVYQVERLGVTDFDIVLFMGVYYHLKDPLLALSALRRVMRGKRCW